MIIKRAYSLQSTVYSGPSESAGVLAICELSFWLWTVDCGLWTSREASS